MSGLSKSVSLVSLMGLLWGCGSQELQVPTAEAFPPTFTSIRDRILIPRCANCHSGVVSHSILLSESGSKEPSIVVGDAEGSNFYKAIESGKMPQYGEKLTEEEVAAVKAWIDAGAKND